MSSLYPIRFSKNIKIKCPCCNSVFYTRDARAYNSASDQFLVRCPVCIDNFDITTKEEFQNA